MKLFVAASLCLAADGALMFRPAVGSYFEALSTYLESWKCEEPYHSMNMTLDEESIEGGFYIYPKELKEYNITGLTSGKTEVEVNEFGLSDKHAASLKLISLKYVAYGQHGAGFEIKLLTEDVAERKTRTVYFNLEDACNSNIKSATIGDAKNPAPSIQIIHVTASANSLSYFPYLAACCALLIAS